MKNPSCVFPYSAKLDLVRTPTQFGRKIKMYSPVFTLNKCTARIRICLYLVLPFVCLYYFKFKIDMYTELLLLFLLPHSIFDSNSI